ncbi:MAG TPA: hypothetical protein VK821_03000 [Dehalococcoidia bacterium]|nr:hypothetical protein [Dehalococcoidia bacterium]
MTDISAKNRVVFRLRDDRFPFAALAELARLAWARVCDTIFRHAHADTFQTWKAAAERI